MKKLGKYDYVIQKYFNPEELPIITCEKGWIAQILIWNYILFHCIQIGLLIIWQIAQQCWSQPQEYTGRTEVKHF